MSFSSTPMPGSPERRRVIPLRDSPRDAAAAVSRELLLHLHSPNAPQWPEDARKMLACACDGKPVDPAVFNRDAGGKTLQGVFDHMGVGRLPAVITSGGKGYLRLTGMGSDGAAIVTKSAATIAQALSTYLDGCLFESKLSQTSIGIDVKGQKTNILYRIHNLCVTKKLDHYREIVNAAGGRPSLEDIEPLIVRAISRGLLSQAKTLDGTDDTRLEGLLPDDETLDIEILDGRPIFLPISDDGKGKMVTALGVMNLVFSMNANLTGPWYVGALRARGYGLIRRNYEGKDKQ